jgi:transposase
MASVTVERLDHWGRIAEVLTDLGLIDRIEGRLVPHRPEESTPGEAVAGMSLNGWGCAHRPLALTPQFVANQPLDLLVREGVGAEMFNRCNLGRTLDEVYAYGGDLLVREMALAVCAQEGLDLRFNPLDTPSVARSGAYLPDRDAQAMTSTPGSAKDHRPDLTQAVLERLVSHDGGVPGVSHSWEGNTSAPEIFQERAAALIATFENSPTPCSVVAEAKRYPAAKATQLHARGLITRMPTTLTLVAPVSPHALSWGTWQRLEDPTCDQRVA